MRDKNNILINSIITTGIFVFITFYVLFLINTTAIQKETPIESIFFLYLGFILLVVSVFIAFNINPSNQNFKFWFISENLVKIILLILMLGSFFIIPSIPLFPTIISWEEIYSLNIIRAIIFIIGCAFLPGSCLFNIFFPKNRIHERFGVESFLLKITIYPLLSFLTLGIVVLVLDQLSLAKEIMPNILISFIFILLILDLIIQKRRNRLTKKIVIRQTVSKTTIVILILSLAVVLFSSGIMLDVRYLIPGDSWVGIAHANYIGLPEASLGNSWVASTNYPLFWGYPTFAMSVLGGLPFININTFLTPFLYLFVTSTYIFMKSILNGLRERYIIKSTILVISFSGLLDITKISDIFQNGSISDLVFDGLFNFRYKSFAYFLFFLGLAFFFTYKNSEKKTLINLLKSEDLKVFALGALFLVISFMTYMLPLLFALFILLVYSLFIKSENKYIVLRNLTIFIILISVFFIMFDLSMNFYLSKIFIKKIFYFFQIGFLKTITDTLPYWVTVYSIFFLITLFCFIVQIMYLIFFKKREQKIRLKLKINSKIVFLVFTFFSFLYIIFLIIHITTNLKGDFIDINNIFLFYYLNIYIFPNIGIIGIVGVFLFYFSYKENKNLFFILLFWTTLFFIISSITIFELFFSDLPYIPTFQELIRNVSNGKYNNMIYWFTRTWIYIIPAISILLVIGLKRFSIYLNKSSFYTFRKASRNVFVSLFIFFSITNLIVSGIYWQNNLYNVSDEEAQTIGWITSNIPDHSNIFMDAEFNGHLIRTLDYEVHKLRYLIEEAYKEYFAGNTSWWLIPYNYDDNSSITMVDEFEGRQNVLKIEDNNSNGKARVNFNFNVPKKHGTIQYYIYSTNPFNTLWVELTDRSIDGLHIWNGYFAYYDGNTYVKLQLMEKEKWYNIILEFECTDSNYHGLNQYEWRVTINGNVYSNLTMYRKNPELSFMEFTTSIKNSNWSVYLDIIHISWVGDFQMEDYFSKIPYIEAYIEKYKINYYIHTLADTWYKRNIERDYLSIQNLIEQYFPIKKYEYGDFIVYQRN